ncbi:DUF1636 family protein [Phaeobacter gallaeciensis]|uniref:DUF1636 family protein n=1 Tax=Phaeobacter gallaeciensis TaxID=60890 RepID=UPI00237F1832|nr:DUF1636 family protein [Phaeobacter gallaeciensis]MDE4305818.1 DUF1636 family protein [Phaeobacter gallaeciensis]MDE4310201.1 DUF1636 family protein [Phaeobacter gallaeciensis]MDE4314713.1 DUF1636 family protein [Phaeobacter gallaeciensis]MDE4319104.1 DUF1636 family protein [Phaeobacter gallaeciensis]MDE4323568.1 DUF1636 family protein [Phaeobacter gallaeciensis]
METIAKTAEARVLICSTCTGHRNREGEERALRIALEKANISEIVQLDFGGCMNACSAPIALGLQGEGRASYVFAGIDPIQDANDVAATCLSYISARKGWIVDATSCGRLRFCLRARLPALHVFP